MRGKGSAGFVVLEGEACLGERGDPVVAARDGGPQQVHDDARQVHKRHHLQHKSEKNHHTVGAMIATNHTCAKADLHVE